MGCSRARDSVLREPCAKAAGGGRLRGAVITYYHLCLAFF